MRFIKGELNYSSFWISQILMLIATVLGVYLAAHEGLRMAVSYEHLMSTKANYYLRQSLKDEIKTNIINIREWSEQAPGIQRINLKDHALELDTYVWDTMMSSPHTLETPSAFLSGTRQFYRAAHAIAWQLQNLQIGMPHGRQQLEALTAQIEEELLPNMQQDIATLRAELEANNITLF